MSRRCDGPAMEEAAGAAAADVGLEELPVATASRGDSHPARGDTLSKATTGTAGGDEDDGSDSDNCVADDAPWELMDWSSPVGGKRRDLPTHTT